MAEKKNIEQLAELLGATVDIEKKDTVEETIEAAIEKLQKNKQTKSIAKTIKDDVHDELKEANEPPELDETIADMYVSNMTPPFWDRVRMKYLGVPDLKSWAELDKINHQALSSKPDDVVEDAEEIPDDTEEDRENEITWEDIEKFLNQLSSDEYLHTCYDDDEYEWLPDEQDTILADAACKQFAECDDDELQQKLEACIKTLKNGLTADQLVEALTLQQRLKKAIKMRSKAKQIALKRKIALKRHATPEKLNDRARKLAIRMLKSRFSGGASYNDLSYADRDRIEKMLDKKKPLIDTLQRKMLPVVKKIEQQRFASKPVNEYNKK